VGGSTVSTPYLVIEKTSRPPDSFRDQKGVLTLGAPLEGSTGKTSGVELDKPADTGVEKAFSTRRLLIFRKKGYKKTKGIWSLKEWKRSTWSFHLTKHMVQ
jgi:hypothetical protein